MPSFIALGLARTPRTQALFDQTVRPDGVLLECREGFSEGYDNTGARHRLILEGQIPGGEMSTSSYILARSRGAPIRALPVFLNRKFRHRCMYCSVASELRHPENLRGKVVTVHRYNSTTAVWVRGLLENEYSVKPHEMTWRIVEQDLGDEMKTTKPGAVRIQCISEPRTREHAIVQVERGEIDAALEPYSDLGKNPRLRRLLQDHRTEEEAYFRKTGVLPVIHTLVLQEKIAEAHPGIVKSLLSAFRNAREMEDAYADPGEKEESRWMTRLAGHDPYGYRLDACVRRSIETLMSYQMQQGLLAKETKVDDLFFADSLDA